MNWICGRGLRLGELPHTRRLFVTANIEFFYDVLSPAAYLAWTQLDSLVRRTGAQICYRPVLLGGLFKSSGNVGPLTVPAKRAYITRDIPRCAQQLGVPFHWNPHFPFNPLPALRGAVSCRPGGEIERYTALVYRAAWERALNIADLATLTDVLSAGGFDAEDVAKRIQRPEIKQALIDNTEEAVQRGAFGVPTLFVEDEMFFGHDRISAVEWYIARSKESQCPTAELSQPP